MKRRRRPPEYGGSGCDAVSAFFDDLRVPREAMLGAEGRGFKAFARARPGPREDGRTHRRAGAGGLRRRSGLRHAARAVRPIPM
jgi:hypothetical protein